MRPVALLILDGWGYSGQTLGNAIASAKTPVMDEIRANYPSILLQASGASVGLTWREPGNSEVGHLTIGAGRTIFQYSIRISRAIENGTFYENPAMMDAMAHVVKHGSTLHVAGLITSGTVHASFDHLLALITMAKKQGIPSLKLHIFTDGKDSGLKEAVSLIGKLKAHLDEVELGQVATVVGRKFAMDRNGNWQWTQKAYDLMVSGIGTGSENVIQAIEEQYYQGLHDGDIEPILMDPEGLVRDNDALIFFNFREDSMRQIGRAFTEDSFDRFPVQKFHNLPIVFMTQYLPSVTAGAEMTPTRFQIAFPPPEIHNGLAETLSSAGKHQLHLAETEKYAHVTYFFNCLRNSPFEGESDVLLESAADPAERPEMQALKIAERFIEELDRNIYDFFVINIANADILAHQGNLEKATEGVQWADSAVRQIQDAILAKDGVLVVTSDHGNAESMVYTGSGDVETKHNPNPVPLHLVTAELRRPRTAEDIRNYFGKAQGILSDVAPTILEIMGVPKPAEMAGESLLAILTR